jgi:hypothetical protein
MDTMTQTQLCIQECKPRTLWFDTTLYLVMAEVCVCVCVCVCVRERQRERESVCETTGS